VSSYVGCHYNQAAHIPGYRLAIVQLMLVKDLRSDIKAKGKNDQNHSSFRLYSYTLCLIPACRRYGGLLVVGRSSVVPLVTVLFRVLVAYSQFIAKRAFNSFQGFPFVSLFFSLSSFRDTRASRSGVRCGCDVCMCNKHNILIKKGKASVTSKNRLPHTSIFLHSKTALFP
jgi:hypothetical protein